MGRVGVDLYPEQIEVTLAEVKTFAKSLGGSATNVAVAAARLGRRAAVITKVGDDAFGAYVRGALRGFGVDDRFVGTHPTLRTPIVFCEIDPPDDFPTALLPRAAGAGHDDRRGRARPRCDPRGARVLDHRHRAVRGAEPDRHLGRAGSPRRRDHHPRPRSPPGVLGRRRREAGHWARAALRHATVAVGNRDEVAVAVRTRDPYAASAHLLDLGVELAVVKRGPEGVLARTRDALVEVPPVPVDVVCGLGAGDAFGGALVHGLLAEWPLERTIRLANAAGAFVAARLACADAMPTLEDIESQEVRT